MPVSRGRKKPRRNQHSTSTTGDPRRSIYHRARSLANLLSDHYQSESFLRGGYHLLRELGAPLVYRSPASIATAEPVLRRALDDTCAELSAYWMLPAMHQFVVDHYSVESRRAGRLPVTLRPFKLMAARIFTASVPASPPRWPAQHEAVRRALTLAFLYEQIMAFRYVQIVDDRSTLTVTPEGFLRNDEAQAVSNAMAATYAGGGLVQRFANQATKLMFSCPQPFLADVWSVLAGDHPRTRHAFAGTHLSRFPDGAEAPGFWVALAARLQLLMVAQQVSVHAGSGGLAILGPTAQVLSGPGLYGTTQLDADSVQQAMMECFWRRDHLADPSNALEQFVLRPAARLVGDRELFVTSTLTVADSITALTEQAVSPAPTGASFELPPSYFERLLSGPFESKVIDTFRESGFVAGEVTKSGSWRTQDGTVQLRAGIGLPGQIDVLAWHPAGQLVVGECKVLLMATTEAALTNQWQKIGPADTEGFRRKLRQKAEWAETAVRADGRKVTQLDKVIVLDRSLHLMRPDDDVIVTDLELVERQLRIWRAPGQ
jgi:hypothetical protein